MITLITGVGRNIRHLPCVSRRTGETGVCMFAFTCAKANGTHLGTCIERFYFGSCCKIDESNNNEPDIFQNENSIDDGPVKPYQNNKPSIESNSIPEYSVKPITKIPYEHVTESSEYMTNFSTVSLTEKKPVKLNNFSTTSISMSTNGFKPSKVTESGIKQSTKPIIETTTQYIGLSTFQSVQNNPSLPNVTKSPQRITTTSTTEKTIITQSNKPQISTVNQSQKPIGGYHNVTRPFIRPSSPKPPTTINSFSTINNKTRITTAKPILTTTQRSTVIGTRFPPRNSTTTTTTTVKPVRPKPNKRPTTISTTTSTTTTKIPGSYTPVKRITTTTTTTSTTEAIPTVTVSKRPVTVTKPTTTVKNITSATIRPSSSTKPENIPSVSRPPISGQERPGDKPTSNATVVVVNKENTTKRPTTTASLDVSTNKPTIPSFKPMPTRPKPVSQGTKVTPTKKPNPTSSTTTTKKPNPSPPRPSSILTSTSTSTTTTLSIPVISNEVITPEDTTNGAQGFDNSKVEATSYSPGLVTWMSNSDDVTTKSSVLGTSTSESEGKLIRNLIFLTRFERFDDGSIKLKSKDCLIKSSSCQ